MQGTVGLLVPSCPRLPCGLSASPHLHLPWPLRPSTEAFYGRAQSQQGCHRVHRGVSLLSVPWYHQHIGSTLVEQQWRLATQKGCPEPQGRWGSSMGACSAIKGRTECTTEEGAREDGGVPGTAFCWGRKSFLCCVCWVWMLFGSLREFPRAALLAALLEIKTSRSSCAASGS